MLSHLLLASVRCRPLMCVGGLKRRLIHAWVIFHHRCYHKCTVWLVNACLQIITIITNIIFYSLYHSGVIFCSFSSIKYQIMIFFSIGSFVFCTTVKGLFFFFSFSFSLSLPLVFAHCIFHIQDWRISPLSHPTLDFGQIFLISFHFISSVFFSSLFPRLSPSFSLSLLCEREREREMPGRIYPHRHTIIKPYQEWLSYYVLVRFL